MKASPFGMYPRIFILGLFFIISEPTLAQQGGGGHGFTVGNIPPSLKTIPVPVPTDIGLYVKNNTFAIRLGKAFFWDTQAGSDGQQACATCHYHAGADARIKNTLNPASDGVFGTTGPMCRITNNFFPTLQFQNPDDRFSPILRNLDDIVGSQGMVRTNFVQVIPGNPVDEGITVPDPVFNAGGQNSRQVTGRNTPSVINAVFNFRNFWDGRANHIFNGVNPFGPRDPNAKIWAVDAATGLVVQETVSLNNSSLASQAVGPPTSDVEMQWNGRTFPDIGRKLLSLQPLGQQRVHLNDSVFASIVHPSGFGLNTTYEKLIQRAFHQRFWDLTKTTPDGTPIIEANFALFWGLAIQAYEATLISDDSPFDQYMDGGGDGGLNTNALTAEQKHGLEVFRNVGLDPNVNAGFCGVCHVGSTFSAATIENIGVLEEGVPGEPPPIPETPLEKMVMANQAFLGVAIFSSDLSNEEAQVMLLDFDPKGAMIEIVQLDVPGQPVINRSLFPPFQTPCPSLSELSIKPTGDGEWVTGQPWPFPFCAASYLVSPGTCKIVFEIGISNMPIGNYMLRVDGVDKAPLQIVELSHYDFGFYNIGVRPTTEDIGLGASIPAGEPLSFVSRFSQGLPVPEIANITIPPHLLPTATSPIRVDGSFKVPILRNVELTGPYFHNGGKATLEDVVDLYARGGDFHEANINDLAPLLMMLDTTPADEAAVVAFLKSLTDERVRWEMAPFDHPEIALPNGDFIPAVGAGGRSADGISPVISFAQKLIEADLTMVDCNANGVPDDCDILTGSSTDLNGNGVPDECDPTPCPADIAPDNGNGTFGNGLVNIDDLVTLLNQFGNAGGTADIAPDNGNGTFGNGLVNIDDLVAVLNGFGACP